jgi:hypothetical protein
MKRSRQEKRTIKKKVRVPKRNKKLRRLLAIFVCALGIVIGILLAPHLRFTLPRVYASDHFKAVGSDIHLDRSLLTEIPETQTPNINLDSALMYALRTLETPSRWSAAASDEPEYDETTPIINWKTQATQKIAQEMLRIQFASAKLTEEFTTSCGDWNAPCAREFRETLNHNNSMYAQLNAALAKLNQEMHDKEAGR